jgi:uncharacterized protein
MVHAFGCLGRSFAVDTESGSVFETDELTDLLLKKRNSPELYTAGEFSRYPEREINEANLEINALQRESVLFSAAPKIEPLEFGGEIKSMCLNITHKCNLKCAYCFNESIVDPKNESMSLNTAKSAVDYLISKSGKKRNLEIDFFGGEPLLNFDVVKQTVEYARGAEKKYNKNFLFTITTNALALNCDIAEFCNREMDNVVISIDGRENVHNSMRKTVGGQDSFQAAVAAAKSFCGLRGDKKYYIRGTFTANNLDFSLDAAALFDYGFKHVSLEPVVLGGNHPLAIKTEHVGRINAEYERLAKIYLCRRAGGEDISFFHFNLDLYNGPCLIKRIKSCGAGCEYIAVTPDGNVYPCHQFAGRPAYVMGNVLSGAYHKEIPLRFSSKNNVYSKQACANCFAKYYCSGGCAANSINFGGRITEPHSVSCAMMKKRIECALAIYAIENE